MDEPARDDTPGKTLRNLFVASLALLLAYVGLWVHALFFPKVHYDVLGMSEPPLSTQVLEALDRVIWVAAPTLALFLLMSGWSALKHGNRRTMKRLLVANGALIAFIVVFTWLPYLALQRRLVEGL
ncbi:MAG TPA: hypothetical protein VJU16_06570 [Planctomycetota bacterium]|nr:hypothetical protein [Planctomycetota bacterium]